MMALTGGAEVFLSALRAYIAASARAIAFAGVSSGPRNATPADR